MSTLSRLRAVAALASSMMVAACGADFDPISRVTDFRLIAVAADKPYAAPGEEVALTTLYHEPFNRPLTWAWTICLNPQNSTVNACLLSLAAQANAGTPPPFVTGEGIDHFTWKVPDDALSSLPEETRQAAMAGVLTIVCPGTLQMEPLATTTETSLPFHCIEAGTGAELPFERFVVSMKRIMLRTRDKNANPKFAEILWDGRPWQENDVFETTACKNDENSVKDCDGGEEHIIGARAADGSAETGVDEFGVAFTEQLMVQQYATEGSFEFQAKTAETAEAGGKWVARNSARGKEVTLWFVLRENRGGVTWTSRRVRVRP